MRTKNLLYLAFIAIVLGIVFYSRSGSDNIKTDSDSAGLTVGRNVIYTAEQPIGRDVSVAVVRLERSGFVAIHEDNAGQPGKILGVGGLLPSGETKNLPPIRLSRPMEDGETLYAMLHFDNGNGIFNPAEDKPVFSSLGNEPVMMIFIATSYLEGGPAEVNL